MSQMQEGRYLTFKAGVDLSAKQYYIVAADASNPGEVILANAQTLPIVGIVENYPEADDTARVVAPQVGTMKVKCGGNINVGAYVTADSNGKAIATTTAGDMVIGRALEAGADGRVIEVELMFFRY
jgi:hypothetical protein